MHTGDGEQVLEQGYGAPGEGFGSPSFADFNALNAANLNAKSVSVQLACQSSGYFACVNDVARLEVSKAEVTVRDPSPPTLHGAPAGRLFAGDSPASTAMGEAAAELTSGRAEGRRAGWVAETATCPAHLQTECGSRLAAEHVAEPRTVSALGGATGAAATAAWATVQGQPVVIPPEASLARRCRVDLRHGRLRAQDPREVVERRPLVVDREHAQRHARPSPNINGV